MSIAVFARTSFAVLPTSELRDFWLGLRDQIGKRNRADVCLGRMKQGGQLV